MGDEPRVPRRNPPVTVPRGVQLDLRTRIIVRLGYWLLRLLGATWRVRVHGRSALLARTPQDARVVVTLWHGQLLPILWAHRQPTASMVSEHKDGEIIAQVLARFGFAAIRGSSSRGGARALLEAVRVLNSSADVAITPDGPRGPRHTFAPGALAVAARAGVAIVPIVAYVDRMWRLNSWDEFEIPKPFARVTIVYGTPVRVDAADLRMLTSHTSIFAARMMEETERALQIARGHAPLPIAPFAAQDAMSSAASSVE